MKRCFLAVFALLAFSFAVSADVKLELPAEVKGDVSTFITVKAETPGKVVKWKVIDPGLSLFPQELLKDTKTAVFTSGKKGTYRVIAVTALGDDVSELVEVKVIVGGGGPVPPPGPPDPPKPDTPLVKAFRAAYDSETSPTKADDLDVLKALYTEAGKEDFLNAIPDWKSLYAAMDKSAKTLGINGKLLKVQALISQELQKQGIPSAASTAKLDAAGRRLVVANFYTIAEALGALK